MKCSSIFSAVVVLGLLPALGAASPVRGAQRRQQHGGFPGAGGNNAGFPGPGGNNPGPGGNGAGFPGPGGNNPGFPGPGGNGAGGPGAGGNNPGIPGAGGNGAGLNGTGANGAGAQPSPQDIQNAVNNWMADTAKVSNFLNIANGLSAQDFKAQAQIGLDAENNELVHKAILDQAFGNLASVQAANNTLVTKGFFQNVVDLLADMVLKGSSAAAADVSAINANRCVNVLPNIDAYFAAAGTNQKAVRPKAC